MNYKTQKKNRKTGSLTSPSVVCLSGCLSISVCFVLEPEWDTQNVCTGFVTCGKRDIYAFIFPNLENVK